MDDTISARDDATSIKDDLQTVDPFQDFEQPLYLPLINGKLIRLIELLPGMWTDQVNVRLLVSELHYAPDYDAISYVWGNPKERVPIKCNGRTMNITLNLNSAFKRIRWPDRSRIVWADAICINQGNNREKSHHVAFMGDVYLHAKKVLVCVGKDPDGNAEDVASLVSDIHQMTLKYDSILDMPVLSADDPILDDRRWRAMSTMLNRPWFTRAWVLQEVGLAKDPLVLYGAVEFPYRHLMQMGVWVTQCAPQLDPRADVSFSSAHIDWMDWADDWRERSAYPTQTLLILLNQTRSLHCTDPRDRIYAYLGHPLCRMPNNLDLIMTPDYNKNPMDVSYELATKLIEVDGVRALAPVEHSDKDLIADYPTWVPWCWPEEWVTCTFGLYTGFYFSASKDITVQPKIGPNRKLKVAGTTIDSVEKVFRFDDADVTFGSPIDLQTSEPEMNESRVLKEIWTYLVQQRPKVDDWIADFAITLTAGLYRYNDVEETSETLEQHLQDFAAYWTIFSKMILKTDLSVDVKNRLKFNTISFANVERFWVDLRLVCEGRSFIITKNGRFGLAPWVTKPGDLCCVLFGGRAPFVLRQESTDQKDLFRLAGECFVQGQMRGEAIHSLKDGQLKEETYIII